MELIHICERDIFNRNKQNISLENLASKQRTFGLLKSTRCRNGIARSPKITLFGEDDLGSSRGSWWAGMAKLVEPAGIEPATFWLQTRRSPS